MKRKASSDHPDHSLQGSEDARSGVMADTGSQRVYPSSTQPLVHLPQSPEEDDAHANPQDDKHEESAWTTITTRKSKACAACRKQKIKCIVDNETPPCRRCKQRGLGCMQNRTLQSLVDDQNNWKLTVQRQIAQLHAALNETRESLSQALIPPLNHHHDSIDDEQNDVPPNWTGKDADMDEDSGHPTPESLAPAPIGSLYEITKLRSLRTIDPADINPNDQSAGIVQEPDFITRGVIPLEESERLAQLYMTRLDHYFYGHVGRYTSFLSVRKTSTMLAACICTVAALHDPAGSDLYDKCILEFRTLVSSSMFAPRIGLEDIRALCIGSYWLCDFSWMLSGYGIRKAITLQLHNAHFKQLHSDMDNFLRSQMWLLLYICDQQISVLHGLPPMVVDKESVIWEQHMASPFATDADLRCVSHIDLLLIMSRIRELYGSDITKPILPPFISQLRHFNAQIDKWGATWSGKLASNKHLGNFPSQAVTLHYHFAKFYLCSHAFRGLKTGTGEMNEHVLSRDLEDIAAQAIAAAFSILQSLLDSKDLRVGLVGVPHYFHTMYTFAAVFLLKLATRYTEYVNIDIESVFDTTTSVVALFESSPCARQHLVHRIAKGLKEMVLACKRAIRYIHDDNASNPWQPSGQVPIVGADLSSNFPAVGDFIGDGAPSFDLENFGFLSALPPLWPSEFHQL